MSKDFTTDELGREWRYWVKVNPHDETDRTIYRARIYQLPEGWAHDAWQYYWEGSDIAAFYVGGYRDGAYILPHTDAAEDSERALHAWKMSQEYDRINTDAALIAVARRITGRWDARFVHVNIDRGTDLYVCSWDGDPDRTWRDEIEAVNYGDIWRQETAVYDPSTCTWSDDDDACEEWYGETNAVEAWHKGWPLAEFPYELVGLPVSA